MTTEAAMPTDFREALATALCNTFDLGHQHDRKGRPCDEGPADAHALLAALPDSIRDAIDLGMAFAEAKAALPEGWAIETLYQWHPNVQRPDEKQGWEVRAIEAPAVSSGWHYVRTVDAEGQTLTECFRALTAKLQEAER